MMRAAGIGLWLAIVASQCAAAPMTSTVQIFNGPANLAVPITPVPGSPLSVTNPTSATASFGFPTSPIVGFGTGSISDLGSLSLYNRSTVGNSQFGAADFGALEVPGSFRVITTTDGIFTRSALGGGNDLTLNIINLALAVYDPAINTKANVQAIVDVTTANGTQTYALNVTLTNLGGSNPLFVQDPAVIVGNVTTGGPTFTTGDNHLYTSPAFSVTFHLGNLTAGSPISIDYRAITTAISPNAPAITPFQSVRAQFGDPDDPTSSANNANLRLSPAGVVQEAPEPSALVAFGICAFACLTCRRRAS